MPSMRPLYGGCPLLGGSVMGGSTVYMNTTLKYTEKSYMYIKVFTFIAFPLFVLVYITTS